jgi:hypothetical protein
MRPVAGAHLVCALYGTSVVAGSAIRGWSVSGAHEVRPYNDWLNPAA